ncbi:hypothetical protein R5R35_013585 [Gryllus longicercus]|uniref:CHK kinase-like domain-containing protein n=1 Tax=Gryllus longicercus TaxID=2509291 RepID=A0AAN9VD57_9ORTH
MDERAPSLSTDEARVIAAECSGTSDFELLELQEISEGKESGGFMSDYLRFKIRIRLQDGTEKCHNLFAKTVPRTPGGHRDFVEEVQCYVKEVGFYRKVLPLLLKHQNNDKRSSVSGVIGKWAPHCYLTRDDIIIMEDLGIFNFRILNSRDLLDWSHCVTVLKKIASFHAASIIFEEKEKQNLEKTCRIVDLHPDCFTDVIDRAMSDDKNKGWFLAGVRAIVALVPYLSKYQHSTKLQRMIQEKIPTVFESVGGLKTSDKYRNVVCHGDLWSSNILFNYGEDSRPDTARFVDYQVLRYAPPATDLVIFINTTTNQNFRKRHNKDMLKIYYKEFNSELQEYGLSANEILSFEELHESFEHFSPAGRAIAGLYYQLILMDHEKKNSLFSSPENYSTFFLIDRSSDVRECFLKDEVFRYRMEEALNELIDKDILNTPS